MDEVLALLIGYFPKRSSRSHNIRGRKYNQIEYTISR